MSDGTLRIERTPPEPAWPTFALPRGTEINGYRLDRILGSGGFGITYLALDLLRQRFAIKEYYPQQFASRQDMTVRPTTVADTPLFEECRERFLREAEALVLLGRTAGGANEGIVRVQTYFEAYGTCFLVMDYEEGDSLADIIRRDRGLTAARLRSLLVQLLTSIRVVHRAGLLHRDIKPANIIIREGDRLVLIDFGATRQAIPTEATSYTQIYSGGYGPPDSARPAAGRILRHLRHRRDLLPGHRRPPGRPTGAAEFAGSRSGGSSVAGRGCGGRTLSAPAAGGDRCRVDRRSKHRLESADAMLEALGRRNRFLCGRGTCAGVRGARTPPGVACHRCSGRFGGGRRRRLPDASRTRTTIASDGCRFSGSWRGSRRHRRQWRSHHRSKKPLWSHLLSRNPPRSNRRRWSLHPLPKSPHYLRRFSNRTRRRSLCHPQRRSPRFQRRNRRP